MGGRGQPLIVSLSGGLGNQLFQWAAGFSLAESKSLDLVLSDLEVGDRGFQLGDFGVSKASEPISDLSRRAILRRKDKETFAQKFVWYSKHPLLSNRLVVEKGFVFDERLGRRVGPGKILKGTFQSERYFAQSSERIKRLLLDGFQPRTETVDALEGFGRNQWAAVHVRRGDYLRFSETFGVLGPDYFGRARDEIRKIFGKGMKFVLFSDDRMEAEKTCDWADSIISSSFGSPSQPLWLMSRASAIIGSNSSYSWWSSFLSPDGTPAIFPKPWFPGDTPSGKDVAPAWATQIARSDL